MKKYAEITRDNRMWDAQKTIYGNAAWVKLPDCGTATVIWGENEEGYEHVSVCPKKKYDKLGRENLPTWNDMCILKDIIYKKTCGFASNSSVNTIRYSSSTFRITVSFSSDR